MKLRTPFFRLGLQAQLLLAMVAVLIAVTVLTAILLMRQSEMRRQVADFSRNALYQVFDEGVKQRGGVRVSQLADALTNPMYYFDLEAIGELLGAVKRTPDVAYVLVYDSDGQVLHDGSGEIPTYGQQMDDEWAAEIIAAEAVLMKASEDVLDVSAPIFIGKERLGGVRIGYSLEKIREGEMAVVASLDKNIAIIARSNRWQVGLLVGLIFAVLLSTLVLVHYRYVRRILRLAEYAHEMETGDYQPDMPESSANDEVGQLERAFARMRRSVWQQDQEIRRMAYTDVLTGLPNRRNFSEALDERLRLAAGQTTLALLFVDVDDFKHINDTLGHEAGDAVLMEQARRLQQAVADSAGQCQHVEIARFGGDEFVIMLDFGRVGSRHARALAAQLASRLIADITRPVDVDGESAFLGASVGITVFPVDATTSSALIKNGDIAMYQAKAAGKRCYRFYTLGMEEVVERRVWVEQALRGAWERGELSLHYQPVYRLADGRLMGAEALLRWQHPVYGEVPPQVFIAVAEESGLIEELGRQVMKAACQAAASWRVLSPALAHVFVSVNLSVRQLRDTQLPHQLQAALDEAGLPAEALHLELTENMVLDEGVGDSRGLMQQLRQVGVKLWLDDFGTGYSGLNHLRRLPVDGVKIDRSFITEILSSKDDRMLTMGIVGLAKSMGIVVVAEGVETLAQRALLQEIGCDFAQGFVLGRPVPEADFLALLRAFAAS